jgi:hypothetical protein
LRLAAGQITPPAILMESRIREDPGTLSMRNALFPALLALVILTGCKTRVYDARGPDEFCEVHHAFMRSVEIPVPKSTELTQDYLAARAKYFPHAYPFYLPPTKGHYMVYLCDYCIKAEEDWKAKH